MILNFQNLKVANQSNILKERSENVIFQFKTNHSISRFHDSDSGDDTLEHSSIEKTNFSHQRNNNSSQVVIPQTDITGRNTLSPSDIYSIHAAPTVTEEFFNSIHEEDEQPNRATIMDLRQKKNVGNVRGETMNFNKDVANSSVDSGAHRREHVENNEFYSEFLLCSNNFEIDQF